MAGQVAVRPDSTRRRESLLSTSPESCSCAGFGEVAGGTTAECAAVWCCCPCGIVNLLVVFVYKLPRAICRRAIKSRRRRRLVKKGMMIPRLAGSEDPDLQVHPMGSETELVEAKWVEAEEEVQKLEKEMWASFYGTGFWRSPSQKELPLPIITK